MRLPGKIVLRPNDFSQPDFSVIYKTLTGETGRHGAVAVNGW